jgi:hypothetical protein
MQGRSGITALILVSILGVLTKVQNIAAVAIAGLALLLWAASTVSSSTSQSPRPVRYWAWTRAFLRSRGFIVGTAIVLGSVIAQAGWLKVRSAISVGPSPSQNYSEPFTARSLISESLKFLTGAAGDPTGMNSVALVTAATIIGWLSVAGIFYVCVVGKRKSIERHLAVSSLIVALSLGPLLAIGVLATSGFYFNLPVRYGMSMLPAFLLCACILLSRNSKASVGVMAIATPIFVASLFGS